MGNEKNPVYKVWCADSEGRFKFGALHREKHIMGVFNKRISDTIHMFPGLKLQRGDTIYKPVIEVRLVPTDDKS